MAGILRRNENLFLDLHGPLFSIPANHKLTRNLIHIVGVTHGNVRFYAQSIRKVNVELQQIPNKSFLDKIPKLIQTFE